MIIKKKVFHAVWVSKLVKDEFEQFKIKKSAKLGLKVSSDVALSMLIDRERVVNPNARTKTRK
jgi:hypothetical protein